MDSNSVPASPHQSFITRYSWLRRPLGCLSLANLLFLQVWSELLYSDGFDYFSKLPVNRATLCAALFNVISFATAFWLLATLSVKWPPWLRQLLKVSAIAVGLIIPLNFLRVSLFHLPGMAMLFAIGRTGLIGLATGLFAVIVIWRARIVIVLETVVLLLTPFAVINSSSLIGRLCTAPEVSFPTKTPLSFTPVSNRNQPRVLWLLFDELDQRIAFSHRPAGIGLPEFDQFARESVVASQAFPPAMETMRSLPSLLTGRSVNNATITEANDLTISFSDNGRRAMWSKEPGILAWTAKEKINTALVGWYHPYPRILGSWLQYSAFQVFCLYSQVRGEDFISAWVNQLSILVMPISTRRLHRQSYLESMRESLSVATNWSYGLTILHLPVPHPPGIYDSITGRLTITDFSKYGGYFDNLRLADRTLGQIRNTLNIAGLWKPTTVIVTTDHFWRAASTYDGQKDFHIPFMVKPAFSSEGRTNVTQFNTVSTVDLIRGVLSGNLRTADQISAWMDQHASSTIPNYDTKQDLN